MGEEHSETCEESEEQSEAHSYLLWGWPKQVQIKSQTIPAAQLFLFRDYALPSLERKGSFLLFTVNSCGSGGCIFLYFWAFIASGWLCSIAAETQRWCRLVLCAWLPSWPTYFMNVIVECVSHRYGCATSGVIINRRKAYLCCWVI